MVSQEAFLKGAVKDALPEATCERNFVLDPLFLTTPPGTVRPMSSGVLTVRRPKAQRDGNTGKGVGLYESGGATVCGGANTVQSSAVIGGSLTNPDIEDLIVAIAIMIVHEVRLGLTDWESVYADSQRDSSISVNHDLRCETFSGQPCGATQECAQPRPVTRENLGSFATTFGPRVPRRGASRQATAGSLVSSDRSSRRCRECVKTRRNAKGVTPHKKRSSWPVSKPSTRSSYYRHSGGPQRRHTTNTTFCCLSREVTAKLWDVIEQVGLQDFKDSTLTMRRVPEISEVKEFLTDLHAATQYSQECFAIAMVYIARVLDNPYQITLTPSTWRPVAFVSLMIAHKYWDDEYLSNQDFVMGYPCHTLQDANLLERTFLHLLQYRTLVLPSTYAQSYFGCRAASSLFHDVLSRKRRCRRQNNQSEMFQLSHASGGSQVSSFEYKSMSAGSNKSVGEAFHSTDPLSSKLNPHVSNSFAKGVGSAQEQSKSLQNLYSGECPSSPHLLHSPTLYFLNDKERGIREDGDNDEDQTLHDLKGMLVSSPKKMSRQLHDFEKAFFLVIHGEPKTLSPLYRPSTVHGRAATSSSVEYLDSTPQSNKSSSCSPFRRDNRFSFRRRRKVDECSSCSRCASGQAATASQERSLRRNSSQRIIDDRTNSNSSEVSKRGIYNPYCYPSSLQEERIRNPLGSTAVNRRAEPPPPSHHPQRHLREDRSRHGNRCSFNTNVTVTNYTSSSSTGGCRHRTRRSKSEHQEKRGFFGAVFLQRLRRPAKAARAFLGKAFLLRRSTQRNHTQNSLFSDDFCSFHESAKSTDLEKRNSTSHGQPKATSSSIVVSQRTAPFRLRWDRRKKRDTPECFARHFSQRDIHEKEQAVTDLYSHFGEQCHHRHADDANQKDNEFWRESKQQTHSLILTAIFPERRRPPWSSFQKRRHPSQHPSPIRRQSRQRSASDLHCSKRHAHSKTSPHPHLEQKGCSASPLHSRCRTADDGMCSPSHKCKQKVDTGSQPFLRHNTPDSLTQLQCNIQQVDKGDFPLFIWHGSHGWDPLRLSSETCISTSPAYFAEASKDALSEKKTSPQKTQSSHSDKPNFFPPSAEPNPVSLQRFKNSTNSWTHRIESRSVERDLSANNSDGSALPDKDSISNWRPDIIKRHNKKKSSLVFDYLPSVKSPQYVLASLMPGNEFSASNLVSSDANHVASQFTATANTSLSETMRP